MSDRHSISPYPIRMPVDLRERLEKCARDGNRSLHAEIIGRLQESFAHESGADPHALTFAISKEKLADTSGTSMAIAEILRALDAMDETRQVIIRAHIEQLTAEITAEVFAGVVLNERGFHLDITDLMKAKLETLAKAKGTDALDEYARIMEQVAKIIEERQALVGDHTETTSQAED